MTSAGAGRPGLSLPDGRSLTLGQELHGVLSGGVLVCDGMQIGPGDRVLPEVERQSEILRLRHGDLKPGQIEGLTEARCLYRSVGMEPTRHRPSSEALLRRVLKGRSLYVINNAVDCCNLASLHFLLPIGMYDLDRIEGDVELRLGRPGEEYEGIRKGPVHLDGRLGLFDDRGPFGSPTSDSDRTCVRDETTCLLAVVMATHQYPEDDMRRNVRLLGDLLERFCGAVSRLEDFLPQPPGANS